MVHEQAISDVATAKLMARFHQAMEQEKMRPAPALRTAQIEMWKQKRWNSRYVLGCLPDLGRMEVSFRGGRPVFKQKTGNAGYSLPKMPRYSKRPSVILRSAYTLQQELQFNYRNIRKQGTRD